MGNHTYADVLQSLRKQRRLVRYYEGEIARLTRYIVVLEAEPEPDEDDARDLAGFKKLVALARKALALHQRLVRLDDECCELFANAVDLRRKLEVLPD
jgi:hypothetical protein